MGRENHFSTHAANEPCRAIVVAIDGWGAGYLGPYGNTWLETPICNRLASRGMLYEHVLVDAPTIESFYQAVWAGGHAALPNAPAGTARSSLVELLQSHGRSSCLITDEPRVADLARDERDDQMDPGPPHLVEGG